MKNYKNHIRALENALKKKQKRLSKIMDYFLTHLGENPDFLEASVPIKNHHLLSNFAKRYIKDILKSKAKLYLFLSRAPESDFVHGYFIAGKHSCTLLYFEKSKIGFLVQQPIRIGGDLYYLRFAVKKHHYWTKIGRNLPCFNWESSPIKWLSNFVCEINISHYICVCSFAGNVYYCYYIRLKIYFLRKLTA